MTSHKKIRHTTNAIANAGMRVRWNIWNLYIHLCWQTVEQQFIPALAIASAVVKQLKSAKIENKIAKIWPGRKLKSAHWIPGFFPNLTRLKNTAQEFRPSICVCRNGSTSERRFGFALTSHGASLRVGTEDLRESRFTTTCIINATSYKSYNEKFSWLRSHLSYTHPLSSSLRARKLRTK